jgi:hypothetical protein
MIRWAGGGGGPFGRRLPPTRLAYWNRALRRSPTKKIRIPWIRGAAGDRRVCRARVAPPRMSPLGWRAPASARLDVESSRRGTERSTPESSLGEHGPAVPPPVSRRAAMEAAPGPQDTMGGRVERPLFSARMTGLEPATSGPTGRRSRAIPRFEFAPWSGPALPPHWGPDFPMSASDGRDDTRRGRHRCRSCPSDAR